MTKQNKKKGDDDVVIVGTRQTTTSKGKNCSSTSGDTYQDDGDDYDDDSDNGVADLRESLPVSTPLPDTQSFMQRLQKHKPQSFMQRLKEHKPDWDNYEEDDNDEEVQK